MVEFKSTKGDLELLLAIIGVLLGWVVAIKLLLSKDYITCLMLILSLISSKVVGFIAACDKFGVNWRELK